MKKIILNACLLTVSYFATSQISCTKGIGFESFYDDFSTSAPVGGEIDNEKGVNYSLLKIEGDGSFDSIIRNHINGSLEASLFHKYGKYSKITFSFGELITNGDTTVNFMDLTEDAKFEISIKNTSSDSAVRFLFDIEDVNGNIGELYAGAENASWYPYIIEDTIEANEKEVFTADFAGAKQIPDQLGDGTPTLTLDFTKISKLHMYVANPRLNLRDNYLPFSAGQISFSIDYIKLGNCSMIVGNVKNELEQLDIFPNPASSNLYLSKQFDEIQLINAIGVVVLKSNKVDQLDVSELENGIYYLKTESVFQKVLINK